MTRRNRPDEYVRDDRPVVVYKATCLANGKVYIGITRTTLKKRTFGHLHKAKPGYKGVFPSAIQKHGKKNFVFEHIATCKNWTDACAAEAALISQENCMVPHGYNTQPGGVTNPRQYNSQEHNRKISEAMKKSVTPERMAELRVLAHAAIKVPGYVHPMTGRKLSAETIAKTSAANRGRKQSEEEIERRRTANKGKKRSPECCARISAVNKGKKLTAEHRAKISQVQIGKKLSDEHKAKLSAATKGRPLTEEHKAKISAGRIGIKFSESHRANIVAAVKRRDASQEYQDKVAAGRKRRQENLRYIKQVFEIGAMFHV